MFRVTIIRLIAIRGCHSGRGEAPGAPEFSDVFSRANFFSPEFQPAKQVSFFVTPKIPN